MASSEDSGAAARYADADFDDPLDTGDETGETTDDGLLNATAGILASHGRPVSPVPTAGATAPASSFAMAGAAPEEPAYGAEDEIVAANDDAAPVDAYGATDADGGAFEGYGEQGYGEEGYAEEGDNGDDGTYDQEEDGGYGDDAYEEEGYEDFEPEPEAAPGPEEPPLGPDGEPLSRAEQLALKKVSARGTTLSVAEQKLFGLSTDGRPLRGRFQVRSKVDLERTSSLAKPKASARTTDGASEAWVAANTRCTCRGAKKKKCQPRAPMPGCARATQVHALVDDSRNCTFAPTRSRKADAAMRDPKCGYDFLGRDEEDNFLVRMEARERSRQAKLEKKRGEAEYDARQDKKQCPQCGMVQSYDEVKSRKKLCPNCRVEYRPARAWGDIGSGFLQRCEEKQVARDRKLRQTAKKVTPNFALAKGTFNSKHKRAVDAKLAGTSFLQRMEQDQSKRADNKKVSAHAAIGAAQQPPVAQASVAQSKAARRRQPTSSFAERMEQSVTLRQQKLKKFDRAVRAN